MFGCTSFWWRTIRILWEIGTIHYFSFCMPFWWIPDDTNNETHESETGKLYSPCKLLFIIIVTIYPNSMSLIYNFSTLLDLGGWRICTSCRYAYLASSDRSAYCLLFGRTDCCKCFTSLPGTYNIEMDGRDNGCRGMATGTHLVRIEL